MKKELTPAERQWKVRLMWSGLGWGYLVMLMYPFIDWLMWNEAPDLSISRIIINVVVWTLAGIGMGRWLQWRAGLIGKRYVNTKNVKHDNI